MEEFGAKKNEDQTLETDFAERPMWLMKCPSLIASALQSLPSTDDSYLPVAKVILSFDPLAAVDEEETKVISIFFSWSLSPSLDLLSHLLGLRLLSCASSMWLFWLVQFVMELARAGSGNIPKRFGLDMSKDFIPMSVFSESSSQGKDNFSLSLWHESLVVTLH